MGKRNFINKKVLETIVKIRSRTFLARPKGLEPPTFRTGRKWDLNMK